MSQRDEDFVEELFLCSTHDYILFFTDRGRVYRLKGYEIGESSRASVGSNIVNLLQLEKGEKVTSMIRVRPEDRGQVCMHGHRTGRYQAYRAVGLPQCAARWA